MVSTLRTILATTLLAVRAANLESLDQSEAAATSSHPTVQARANSVQLISRNNVNYFGSLYAGTHMKELSVSFDTMSQWTVLLNSGSSTYSPYDVSQSKSAVEIFHDKDEETVNQHQNVDLGQIQFNGLEYMEDVCLL